MGGRGHVLFDRVVITGQEPFGRGKILSYLSDLGAKVKEIGHLEAPALLVVGRRKVDLQGIEHLLERGREKALRICPQEMLLAWATTGIDPNERLQE